MAMPIDLEARELILVWTTAPGASVSTGFDGVLPPISSAEDTAPSCCHLRSFAKSLALAMSLCSRCKSRSS